MIALLAGIIRSFTPLSFMAGLVLALRTTRDADKATRPLSAAVGVGLTAAVPLYVLSARSETLVSARVALAAAAVVGALIQAGALLPPESRGKASSAVRRGAAVAFLAVLALNAMFSFLDLAGQQGLSAVAVMNTELILNLGAIALGAGLAAVLTALTAHVAPKGGRRVTTGCLLAASALMLAPWCAEVLLGLMRLKVIAVDSAALSFVAKAGRFAAVVPYVHLALLAGLALLHSLRRTVVTAEELAPMPSAPRRLALTGLRAEARWLRASGVFLCAAVAVLLAQDLYASRPPRITRPVPVTADASGSVRVKLADVDDGGLHRFSYVTDDGHVVRFLLIKLKGRSARAKFGVVYDACVMCGDKGYVQRKDEVVCLACNVRIFNPSIGKDGGCNPIPLPHSVEGDAVVIDAAELEKGAQHFSQTAAPRDKKPRP